ncbi:MAG TPA: ParB/RepB/Spo0J family partition protein [Candidatus Acidoferrum sp.]|nr:ParB/RepB/Spo0J family partition protein [Candidatus Acidoferrum sp.]
MNDEVKMIPLDQIRILNPRHRDAKKFMMIVQSITNQGLKKPIQVSERKADEGEGPTYDLVCGQGRIEAFRALGYNEIPAVVVQISKEDRLLRSLAENMARRNPAPIEMLTEIERLKKEGLTLHQISARLDMDPTSIHDLLTLKKSGETRLLDAALSGRIPVGVAVEIARTEGIEMQRELLKACENRQLTQNALRMIRRVMDRRRLIGKQRGNGPRSSKQTRTSADSLVNAYRRESQKQRLMVKKARVCEAKLLFVVTALRRLLADEHFVTLLRAEDLATMPKDIWIKVTEKQLEMA